MAHAWVGAPNKQYAFFPPDTEAKGGHFQIHAEYDKSNDLYLPHRVVQAFEMSQFIKATSTGADLSIATGDLNMEPLDLGYRLVITNAVLEDAWMKRLNKVNSPRPLSLISE